MIKLGVFGKHEKANQLIGELEGVEEMQLIGYYNPSSSDIRHNDSDTLTTFQSVDDLLLHSDVIYIAELGCNLFETANLAFRNTKHVFIEQISGLSLDEVETLLNHSKEANVKCVIGSSELSHPAFIYLQELSTKPHFIETQRQLVCEEAQEADIIFDLMIKDIAMILQLVKSDMKRIMVKGDCLFSNQIDLLSARLEFANGCIANLLVNTAAWQTRSKMMVYEKGKMMSADFIENKVKYTLIDQNDASYVDTIVFTESASSRFQLENFKNHLLYNTPAMLSLRAGYEKLVVANQISEKINHLPEE